MSGGIGGHLDNVRAKCEFHQVDCNGFAKMEELLRGMDLVYHRGATAYAGPSLFTPHVVTQKLL